MNTPQSGDHDIAIIGMAGRFPGSATIAELWEHLVAGDDTIARFTANEASSSPMLPGLAAHPRFIGAEGVLAATRTDPSLLRLRPHEVTMLDTQSALFFDCVLAAFEDAGYDPFDAPGRVALYGAASVMPLVEDLLRHGGREMNSVDLFSRAVNTPDALPTRAAHLFGFRGEAIAVNTACSSGLVAVHMACQSLLIGSSDLAVAIAVSVPGVQKTGYAYDEGFIGSSDGVVRPFDAAASGTVQGHGVGAVLLKPCSDALRDRDQIYAVIRASAINNDGREKVGFTAPSVSGQAAVIAEAHALAGITADQVGYVETHGTATKLGDPVEVAGLTRAFRETTTRTGFCQLGAVKANIGHLDRAAGMAGLIKTALVVHHGTIPPLSHFQAPNPELDLGATPFTVPDKAVAWPGSRVAGVSSFGIGGTNAHAVLAQAPELSSAEAARITLLVTLSAVSETALDRAAHDLAAVLEWRSAVDVADSVYSCNTRRLHWPVRRAIVGADAGSLVGALRSRPHSAPQPVEGAAPRIAFVFAGMGSNPAGIGARLYATEPLFRDHVDACHRVLHELGFDVRSALVDLPVDARLPAGQFGASLFVLETGLVRLLGSWGIGPEFVIGHSFGEYAAAVSAGMLTLDQALQVVAVRCHAMDAMTAGAMLVTGCASEEAEAVGVRFGVEVAARNAPEATVFSGPPQAIAALRAELASRRVLAIPLGVDRALHSRDVDPVLPRILEAFSIPLAPPSTTFVSTVTGAIETQRVLRPEYWTEQMRRPVLFSSALLAARQAGANVFVEIGPSGGLVPLVVRNFDKPVPAFPSLTNQSDARSLYALLGGLWELGAAIDWRAFYAAEQRRRVSVPIHPRPDELPENATPALEIKLPKLGEVQDGYAYKGGDPADPSNWIEVRHQ